MKFDNFDNLHEVFEAVLTLFDSFPACGVKMCPNGVKLVKTGQNCQIQWGLVGSFVRNVRKS